MSKTINLQELLRPNIRGISPYSSARSEFSGDAEVFLDANENFQDFVGTSGSPRNRYPDPFQRELKDRVAKLFGISAETLFLGNGSDEAIDLLYRAFAAPGVDKAVILPPTYGVYKVFADVNDIEVIRVPLTSTFTINMDKLRDVVESEPANQLKLLFVCSPNNPTGNSVDPAVLKQVLEMFPGIVVVDEAYQDFSSNPSAMDLLGSYENLVVLRTFSKAWGLANVRLGMAIASPEIALVLKNIKYPYNLSGPAQEVAARALETEALVREGMRQIIASRLKLTTDLCEIPYVQKVYPSDANFILVKVTDADRLYHELRAKGIIIRNRNSEPGCEGCVRITIGSDSENARLAAAMKELGGVL
ncbi:MAG: histidinol-phosphate transaminase [Bacteroidetes bacterium]|nr:histidinol-phosphate transaminase [Bacteroidota bacterium]